ncbi:MAG: STAS domain-containing protein [Planctomycetales bacterium]|nr:STAS domain-containing protein [Planctomycetales bacterium]
MDSSSLTVSDSSGVTVITLHTRDLVEHTVFELRPQVLKLLPSGPARWVLNLPETEFIASAGIGLIVQIAHKLSSNGGKLALCILKTELVELFRAPYFLQSVAIFSDVPTAVAALSPH